MAAKKTHDISDHKDEVGQTMHRWKHHDPKPLHSGVGKKGKEGKVVKSKEQAIAIALSMAGKSDHAEKLMSLGYSEETVERVLEILGDFETLDFTRCQRPDGSLYGTRFKCRPPAVEAGPKAEKAEAKPKSKAKKEAAEPRAEAKPKAEPKPRAKKAKAQEPERESPVPKESREEMKAKLQSIGPWNDDRAGAFDRITKAQNTKELGQIVRKLEKEHYDQDLHPGLSAGYIANAKRYMKEWLEANQRSGVGAAEAKRREQMTPEELRRANSADRIRRGIQGGVVNPRMR